MKQSFLLLAFALIAGLSNAQVTKKRMYEGDSVKYIVVYDVDTSNRGPEKTPHYKSKITVLKEGKPVCPAFEGVFSECWFCDNAWMWVQMANSTKQRLK